jgi:hypothetical protein
MTKIAKKGYYISEHAQERIRQRVGLQSLGDMRRWATERVEDGKFVRKQPDGRDVYANGNFEIVIQPETNAVVTVLDHKQFVSHADRFKQKIEKEAKKSITYYGRLFRKAEINVAEITLNMLKARNPKIKAKLNERLTMANDEKEKLATEITVIRKAAKQYGVEV